MKYLIALLLISSSVLAAPRTSLKSSPLEDHSLTAFLKVQLLNLRNQDSTLLSSIPVDNLNLNGNDSTLIYSLNVSSVAFRNLPIYSVSKVNADLTNGLVHFELDILDLGITGNYNLDGSVSSVIALKGNGRVTISIHSVTIIGKGDFESVAEDGGPEIGSIDNLHFVSIGAGVNATFEGIVGEEIIGDLIKEHLEQIGSDLFDSALEDLNKALQPIFTDYLNSALEKNSIASIFNTRVLDTASDLTMNNGWYVDQEDCLYSESKINFTCTGQQVVLDKENGGSGFWASCTPVVAEMCTFYYRPAVGERVHQIKLDAYYIDNPPTFGMAEIYYVDQSWTTVKEFNENGTMELDSTKFISSLTVYPNYAPYDEPEALYTIIERLTAVTSQDH